ADARVAGASHRDLRGLDLVKIAGAGLGDEHHRVAALGVGWCDERDGAGKRGGSGKREGESHGASPCRTVYSSAVPGSASLRCCSASIPAGMTCAMATLSLLPR